GFAAHRLEAASPASGGKPGERFVVKHDNMHALAVRPGLARYGGDLYLDHAGRPTRIVLGGRDVLPSMGKEWDFAKFTFRASSLVGTTAYDHLGRCHYVIANALYLASHRHLKLDHPLRTFVSPFHFRTGAINYGAVSSLVPEAGLVHRASGLTWDALSSIWKGMTKAYSFETLPAELRRKGVHPEAFGSDEKDLYPYGTDALEFWHAIHDFVGDALEKSPALQSALTTRRDETSRWWESLAKGIPGIPELTTEGLRDVLTLLFFTVSGFHNFVGTVTEYVADPTFTAGKLWPGVTMADRQSTMQLCLIASTTGFELPRISGDFSHLMPDDGAKDASRRFRTALKGVQANIDARNAKREQPFRAFEPDRCSLSVGV
ncbi:MAG: hypothetical protein JNG84_12370, partial [Archangium sp.]|nr:hypothetical protein [Archangium sp.]